MNHEEQCHKNNVAQGIMLLEQNTNMTAAEINIVEAMARGEYRCETCLHADPPSQRFPDTTDCGYSMDQPWFKACSEYEPHEATGGA